MKATFKDISMTQVLAYIVEANLDGCGLIVQENYVNHNITVESNIDAGVANAFFTSSLYSHPIMMLIGVMVDDGEYRLISVL